MVFFNYIFNSIFATFETALFLMAPLNCKYCIYPEICLLLCQREITEDRKLILLSYDCCNFYLFLTNLIISGFLGVISMLVLSLHKNLRLAFALLSLVTGSAGIAIADVTIDACVTQHTLSHPSLAGDMQSLCGLSSSIGALLGFSLSGFFVHLLGAKVYFLPWYFSGYRLQYCGITDYLIPFAHVIQLKLISIKQFHCIVMPVYILKKILHCRNFDISVTFSDHWSLGCNVTYMISWLMMHSVLPHIRPQNSFCNGYVTESVSFPAGCIWVA